MINYQDVLKKIFISDNQKLFHGLSFVVISLIALHISIYFNFFKFSSNWIENESKKTTFIITNSMDEKEIPMSVNDEVVQFLSNYENIESFTIIDSEIIKGSLGLENLHNFSGLGMPLIFQVASSEQQIIDQIYTRIIEISEDRLIEKYSHKDQLYEISIVVNRIKTLIFLMFILVIVLFSFLIMNMVKAALVANFKFLEMLQIMGANSMELAKSISYSIVKRILPGAFIGLVFVFLISSLLVKIFGVNFSFFNSSFFWELNIMTLMLLIFFLIIFLILLLLFLTYYLFYFFEKRFFDKI